MMGKTYTSKVTVQCAKQHTCVSCASKFTYVLVRNLQGSGNSAAAAEANAAKLAMKAVRNDIDYHPCPGCGAVQPEMAAVVVSKRFWIAVIVALSGIGIALLLGLPRFTHVIPAAWVGVAATAAAAVIAAWANLYAPNRDLDANRRRSDAGVQAGKLRFDERGAAGSDNMWRAPAAQKLGHRIAAVLCLAAVAATAAAPALQFVNRWPTNDVCYPEVVGPGDETRFYFDSSITSIKSKWYALESGGAITNAAQLGAAPKIFVTTKEDKWGDSISGKNVRNATNKMFADVKFGSKPDVAGKEVALELFVRAKYPYELENKAFEERIDDFRHKARVTMAPEGAGGTFYRSYWEGELLAAALAVVALLLALNASKSLRGEGNPAVVTQTGEESR